MRARASLSGAPVQSAYRDQHARLAVALESSAATGARLRAAAEESAARGDAAEARSAALGGEFGARLADLRGALAREADAAASAESARAAAAADKARLTHEARQAEGAREGLAARLGAELSRTKRLEAKLSTLEEQAAQRGSAELDREALKSKLRSTTVAAKDLGKELAALRRKHEATVHDGAGYHF
jgi:chromosome segregation ATPase